jgi:hypothetical protein
VPPMNFDMETSRNFCSCNFKMLCFHWHTGSIVCYDASIFLKGVKQSVLKPAWDRVVTLRPNPGKHSPTTTILGTSPWAFIVKCDPASPAHLLSSPIPNPTWANSNWEGIQGSFSTSSWLFVGAFYFVVFFVWVWEAFSSLCAVFNSRLHISTRF